MKHYTIPSSAKLLVNIASIKDFPISLNLRFNRISIYHQTILAQCTYIFWNYLNEILYLTCVRLIEWMVFEIIISETELNNNEYYSRGDVSP